MFPDNYTSVIIFLTSLHVWGGARLVQEIAGAALACSVCHLSALLALPAVAVLVLTRHGGDC